MGVKDRQMLSKRVVHFFENIANRNKFETVSHFVKEGFKQRGLYYIIHRYLKKGSALFEHKSGRPVRVATPENIKKVKKLLMNSNKSVKDTAKEVGISSTRVQDIKTRLGMKTRKCQNCPKYKESQEKRAKTNCRKIYRKSIKKILIIDDETYVKADPRGNYGSMFYNYLDFNEVPNDVKFIGKEKYPQKYMVWQAMDQFGNVSEAYVKVGTLTSEEYLNECLIKRLIPFIKKYHKSSQVLFWADMARVHYAKVVLNWLKSQNIDYIEWKENAPNVPQARPIEKFWALCKRLYSKQRCIPKNLIEFQDMWSNVSRTIAKKSANNLMKGVRRTLRLIGDKGVYAVLNK